MIRVLVICLFTFGAFGFTACGFTPLHSVKTSGPSTASPLNTVEIVTERSDAGYSLRNLLTDKFYTSGEPGNPLFRLDIDLRVKRKSLGLRKDDVATRAQLTALANFKLINRDNGETLLTEQMQAITSYNILNSQFTTEVTQRDAENRALNDLADRLALRLQLYFRQAALANPGDGA